MSNDAIKVFEFGDSKVRTAGTFGVPLFCAADVCEVLGIERADAAVNRLDQDDVEITEPVKKGSRAVVVSGEHANVYLTESGLYELIFQSRKPQARAFKKWVTSEVLPEIRRRGYYSALEIAQRKTTEQLLAEAFPNLPGPSKPMFSDLITALQKLRREQGAPSNPPWARTLARLVYGWAFHIDGEQQRRRELNPNPSGSSVDHAMFSDIAAEAVRRVVTTGRDLAKVSVNWDDWRNKMELIFGKKALQLPFMVPMALPGGTQAAE
jgi:prophage antirepressor-like protein